MKNNYSKVLLDFVYNRYMRLKKDDKYRMAYKHFCKLSKALDNCINEDKKHQLHNELSNLWDWIKMEWELRGVINPDSKLKKESLYKKTITPNSIAAKIFYAFNLDIDPKMVRTSKLKKTVSEEMRKMDLRVSKYLCYAMYKKSRGTMSYRALARRFKVDKKTVQNWIKEATKWSEGERNAVAKEVSSSRPIPDMDMLDSKTQRFYKVSYGLTKDGFYSQGKKLRHKPFDDSSE